MTYLLNNICSKSQIFANLLNWLGVAFAAQATDVQTEPTCCKVGIFNNQNHFRGRSYMLRIFSQTSALFGFAEAEKYIEEL